MQRRVRASVRSHYKKKILTLLSPVQQLNAVRASLETEGGFFA